MTFFVSHPTSASSSERFTGWNWRRFALNSLYAQCSDVRSALMSEQVKRTILEWLNPTCPWLVLWYGSIEVCLICLILDESVIWQYNRKCYARLRDKSASIHVETDCSFNPVAKFTSPRETSSAVHPLFVPILTCIWIISVCVTVVRSKVRCTHKEGCRLWLVMYLKWR